MENKHDKVKNKNESSAYISYDHNPTAYPSVEDSVMTLDKELIHNQSSDKGLGPKKIKNHANENDTK